MELVAFLLVLKHAWVGLAIHVLVKLLAKTLCGLGHLFIDFLVKLGDFVLYQVVGTVSLLRVAVVNQRVVESVNVTRSFPDSRVHENGRVKTHYVLVQKGHCLPPVALDVVFEFNTVLSVVINCSQSVVNLARRKNKSVFLGV